MYARSLIVLLLVLNLGVAVWWLLRAAPQAAPALQQATDIPRLQLVLELPKGTAVAAAVNPAATPDASAPQAAAVCLSFGPFASEVEVEAARAALAQQVQRSAIRRELRSRGGGAWDVLLPPQADHAAAQAMAQRIDAAGFKDYYVVAGGAAANAIALGRFGSQEAAQRQQAALVAAGFAVQVRPPEGATRFWLDVATGAAFDPAAAAQRIGQPAQPSACPALG